MLPAQIALPDVPGWHRVDVSVRAPWMPWYPGADHYLFGRYADVSGATVDMSIAVFGNQHEGKELIAFGTGVLQEEDRWVRVADLPSVAGGSAMRIVAPGPVERTVATWYRVGSTVTADERRVKLETMRVRLMGGNQVAVALHIATHGGGDPAVIARFVAATGGPDALIERTLR